ncbi:MULTISPECIES: hypothetical protein [unclassified Methylibium]|uniref:hypothetical protein n=1 Tax=unclassified Methylibium TaxID=2633235 RepID=UPI0003F44823|nr:MULTISPECIES: hypothetical protein [unclassified Methylibium]EWS53015.1 hypothetical protein X551_04193 [Methylibium sp. T29]EWS57604.1 hypothetical protein Y694_04417 [Methylibium sp. T29-B]
MPSKPEQSLPLSRRVLYGITNWALLVAGLANLAAGTFAAFSDSPAVAATSLTAGLVLLFAATVDRFESFKGLGIEAKTRQLDEKINQADEALKRLRQMTELTGTALIDLNCKMGRFDSAPSPREFFALADRIRELMRSLGSTEQAISLALAPWAKTLCFDIARAKADPLNRVIRLKMEALERERQAIPQPMHTDDPTLLRVNQQMRALSEFQTSRLRSLHKLALEDFPDKFMALFTDVPMTEDVELIPLRQEASRFAGGMLSLVKSRELADRELWIEALNAAREQ